MWPPSADFLDKLSSPVTPGTSGFCGNWIEDVRAGQFIVIIIIIIINSAAIRVTL